MKINLLILIGLFSIQGICQKDSILFTNQELILYNNSGTFKGKELYNAVKDLNDLIEREKTDECGVDYDFFYNPLSLVGEYYSYESGQGGTIACGVPSNTLTVQTIDLNNGQAISLSAIFSEESILKALKADQWVKKNMEERKIDFRSIDSFEAFLAVMNSFGYVNFTSNGFAILDYDPKKGKASVRLVGAEYMGYNHYKHLQLGFWIKPRDSYGDLFETNTYFTIGDYQNGLNK
ncbi:hypothetical protein FGM00_19265 [Aggregatimonas sangjinii]|uniref:Uncharacterized protein n=1 Tax=Aggregatimonas sangjinii TaxID=2583587 RepID=A0A5B7SZF1_9FLAO|nr:hypothetical protein [Aggregatimonas sangjinii]QCX02150.1 hypothetical protein FGM00_19265 [Aggregatimonas sangjinii]